MPAAYRVAESPLFIGGLHWEIKAWVCMKYRSAWQREEIYTAATVARRQPPHAGATTTRRMSRHAAIRTVMPLPLFTRMPCPTTVVGQRGKCQCSYKPNEYHHYWRRTHGNWYNGRMCQRIPRHGISNHESAVPVKACSKGVWVIKVLREVTC